MRRIKSLDPYEFRFIRIDQNAIVELTLDIVRKNGSKIFCLSHDELQCTSLLIDHFYDAEVCEILLFAHNCKIEIDVNAANTYAHKIGIDAQNSIFNSTDDKENYISVLNPSFILDGLQNTSSGNTSHKKLSPQMTSNLNEHGHPLGEKEVRILCLSQNAIRELLWEFFVENGCKLMDIPQADADECRIINCMHVEECLNCLSVYIMNNGEASNESFSKIDTYCKAMASYTSESLISTHLDGPCYERALWSHL